MTFKCMLAQNYREDKVVFPSFVEPKYDGIRMIIKCGETINLFSRSGQNLNDKFPDVIEIVEKEGLSGTVLDCEVIVMDGDFQDIMTRMTKGYKFGAKAVRVIVFDCITIEAMEQGWYGPKAETRLPNLRHLELIQRVTVRNQRTLDLVYKGFCYEGYEGIVIKDIYGSYEFKKSYNWMKRKPIKDIDLKVVGMKEGKGRNEGRVGTLTVAYNGHKLNVAGMTDEQRNAWWKQSELIVGKIIEIHYQRETRDGKLWHPRFKRVREDK